MAENPIVLFGFRGPQEIYDDEDEIPEDFGFTSGKIGGSTSFYVVYSEIDYCSKETVRILDSPSMVEFGFVARSLQGWNKVGISIFDENYCGVGDTYESSTPSITDMFGDEAHSFIVMKGVWAVYSEVNYEGIQISVDGKNEFGPGSRIPSVKPESVKSVKLLRED